MPFRDLEHLMLAIGVESGPADLLAVGHTPIPGLLVSSMSNSQLAAFVWTGQAHNQGAKLGWSSGRVDVSPELTRRAGVDLARLQIQR